LTGVSPNSKQTLDNRNCKNSPRARKEGKGISKKLVCCALKAGPAKQRVGSAGGFESQTKCNGGLTTDERMNHDWGVRFRKKKKEVRWVVFLYGKYVIGGKIKPGSKDWRYWVFVYFDRFLEGQRWLWRKGLGKKASVQRWGAQLCIGRGCRRHTTSWNSPEVKGACRRRKMTSGGLA